MAVGRGRVRAAPACTGEAGDPPFQAAVGGASGAQAMGVEQTDGVLGQHAILTAAVGDDLLVTS